MFTYSSTQQANLAYTNVKGFLELPKGPGPVWPLILAAYWLGLGHHTTEGFGAFSIVPPNPENRYRPVWR